MSKRLARRVAGRRRATASIAAIAAPGEPMLEAGWQIEFVWKEVVIYWEGKRGCQFFGGWGVEPPVTYVPDASCWDGVVPDWMKGRRDEILARLRGHPPHVIEELSYPWGWKCEVTR